MLTVLAGLLEQQLHHHWLREALPRGPGHHCLPLVRVRLLPCRDHRLRYGYGRQCAFQGRPPRPGYEPGVSATFNERKSESDCRATYPCITQPVSRVCERCQGRKAIGRTISNERFFHDTYEVRIREVAFLLESGGIPKMYHEAQWKFSVDLMCTFESFNLTS